MHCNKHPLDGMIGSLMPTATELDDPFRLVAELLKGFLASIIHQKCKSRQAHSSGRINTGKTFFEKKGKGHLYGIFRLKLKIVLINVSVSKSNECPKNTICHFFCNYISILALLKNLTL